MKESVVGKKSEMYAMIMAIEADFIENFARCLALEDIPAPVLARANRVQEETNEILSYLRGLDIQSYCEICIANIDKLSLNLEQRRLLSIDLPKIIPIRNRVMHPRLLEITDYPILKTMFEILPKQFTGFSWKEIYKTDFTIKNHPDDLLLPPMCSKKSDNIIENIPSFVDFEETSFIGRKREIGEIKEKLNKKNVHILSVIGDGGVGKTAIIVKMLYDMLDDPACPYNLILWVSLKTNELNGYEFKNIDNAISDTAKMYEKLGEFVGNMNQEETKNYLIELAKQYKMLFVLDNFETINTSEIKEFLDDLTEYAKVLITSRIGLGEMEHRYRLIGLNRADVIDYMDVLLELYGFSGLYTNAQKIDIAENHLHSNPLAIKWFIKCVYSGQETDRILSHKEDVVSFCMSNVYEKLSDNARRILDVIRIVNTDVSYGEMIYYTNSSIEESVNVSYAINELIKCNFLDDVKYRVNGRLSITEFAGEYIKHQSDPDKILRTGVQNRSMTISEFRQQLEQRKEIDPYGIFTFRHCGSNIDRIIAAFYLTEALKNVCRNRAIEEALRCANLARKISPNYSECCAVFGYCYAKASAQKAREEYELGLTYCVSEEEKALLLMRYSRFCKITGCYSDSINLLQLARDLQPLDVHIQLELIKMLCWVNRFSEAKRVFSDITFEPLTEELKRTYLVIYADMLRREAENYAQNDSAKAFEYLKEGYEKLESCANPNGYVYDMMANILRATSYLFIDNEIVDFLLEKLGKHFYEIRGAEQYRRFRDSMKMKMPRIDDPKMREILMKYLLDANSILEKIDKKYGVVVAVKEYFGFIRVRNNEAQIYFKKTSAIQDIEVGDVVEHGGIFKEQKGYMTPRIKFLHKGFEVMG